MRQNDTVIIGVIGTGVTGKGLVELALNAGCSVILKSRQESTLENAMTIISGKFSKKMDPDELQNTLSNVETTTRFESLSRADIIIESVVEDLHIKRDLFQKLELICNDDTVLASNTSSLSISKIATYLQYPNRVVGLHFFNPIPKMSLVEIIKGDKTSSAVIEKCRNIAIKLNKTPIVAKDSPGFIVNRLLFSMINEGCCLLEEGVANVEDIDTAMKLGTRHPMGPFELADLIGIDLCAEISTNLNKCFDDDNKFKCGTLLLQTLVNEKRYGQKSRKGFYDY